MRKMLNTLFVTSEDIYLTLDGENVVANRNKEIAARYPLHTLSGIVSFSYPGASPALMGACADRGISLAFCTPRGKFLARVQGEQNGNVLLRRTQYRVADDDGQSCRLARTMIFGKLYNSRCVSSESAETMRFGWMPKSCRQPPRQSSSSCRRCSMRTIWKRCAEWRVQRQPSTSGCWMR